MRLLSLILLVGLLTFIQSWWGFSIFGVEPNLALISVISASFFVANFWQGFLLVALSAFILKFSPGFEKEILIFSLLGAGAMFVRYRFPWHYFFDNLILITLATLIFYAILSPGLILSALFLEELFLNLIFGTLIFAFLYLLWQDKEA